GNVRPFTIEVHITSAINHGARSTDATCDVVRRVGIKSEVVELFQNFGVGISVIEAANENRERTVAGSTRVRANRRDAQLDLSVCSSAVREGECPEQVVSGRSNQL